MSSTTDSTQSNQPEQPWHPYDARGLSPRQFLLAIMRDRSLPLVIRMDAASRAMPLCEYPAPLGEVGYRIDPPGITDEHIAALSKYRRGRVLQ
jgi:hypothetical protein